MRTPRPPLGPVCQTGAGIAASEEAVRSVAAVIDGLSGRSLGPPADKAARCRGQDYEQVFGPAIVGVVGIDVADKVEGPVVAAVDETARPSVYHRGRGHGQDPRTSSYWPTRSPRLGRTPRDGAGDRVAPRRQ